MIAKIVLWIVIIGGVAIGGNAILKQKAADKQPEEAAAVQSEETSTKPEEKKMAFSSFIKSDTGSYKCTVHQYISDVDTKGTVYISAGKLRGEFSTIAEGRPMTSSILFKDGYQYVWSPLMPTGIKMEVAGIGEGSPTAGTSGTYSWNADQIGDYQCDPWTPDAATFALPSSIVFTDIKAMIKPY